MNKTEFVKIGADSVAGVTIGEATDTNGLIITLFTIVGRLIIESFLNRRQRRKDKQAQNAA